MRRERQRRHSSRRSVRRQSHSREVAFQVPKVTLEDIFLLDCVGEIEFDKIKAAERKKKTDETEKERQPK